MLKSKVNHNMQNFGVPALNNFIASTVIDDIAHKITDVLFKYKDSMVNYELVLGDGDEKFHNYFVVRLFVYRDKYMADVLIEGGIENALKEAFSTCSFKNFKAEVICVEDFGI